MKGTIMNENMMRKILLTAAILGFALIIGAGGWLIYDLCISKGASVPMIMLAEGANILAVVGFFISCADTGIPGDML